MSSERKWPVVPPQAFTANGTAFGVVTVGDTAGFKVKQSAYLIDNTGKNLPVQIKRVISPTQLIVGLIDNKIGSWTPLNITSWLVANSASIGAQEQEKNNIPWEDHYRAIYESDPTVADRVVFVDKYGQFYDLNNPLPISFDGTVQIGEVSIVDPNTKTPVKVNADGSINVVVESAPTSTSSLVNTYNEIVSIPSGSTTQLVTYTVPVGKQAFLEKSAVSGENIARYDILINGTTQDTIRTMFGGNLNGVFDFTSGGSGILLNAGDEVIVQVLHNRPSVGTFEARIQVVEIAL